MDTQIKVLIFGADGRQGLPICKGFNKLGCKVITYCDSRLATGYLSRYVHEKILFEKYKKADEDFISCGIRLIKENKYTLVVPLGDDCAAALSRRKKELQSFARIVVNDWPVFEKAYDKLQTMRICQENGIPAPYTLITDNIMGAMKSGHLQFPVVIKPRSGKGSIGFCIIHDMDMLERYLANNENGPVLIQEYVDQKGAPQYRVDLFRDRNGDYKAGLVGKVTRWYPLDGGSGIFAITVHDEAILKHCKKLLELMDWDGYANIDLVWDPYKKCAKILEINARTGATIMQDFAAGINISQLILENEMGQTVTDMNDYEDGVKVSCFLPDLLWFIKSPDRFRTQPSWFDRRRIVDTVFAWDDPLPTLGFIINNIAHFKNSMRSRKRVS